MSEGEKEESTDGSPRLFGMRVLVREWAPKDMILIATPHPPKLVAIRPARDPAPVSERTRRTREPTPTQSEPPLWTNRSSQRYIS